MSQEFNRNSVDALIHWYRGKSPRKPVVFRGARQVGKSSLVRLLAKQLGVPLHEINLERHARLNSIFESRNLPLILKELEFAIGHESLEEGILFLDEIQTTPAALAALRDFYEQSNIAVIAAGSLLEFALQDFAYSMPVGRIQYHYVGPCLFSEYLGALGQNMLVQLLKSWEWSAPFPQSAHEQFLFHFRNFLLVGGMPEAIAKFVDTGRMESALRVHQSILQTYEDDFGKYASKAQISHMRKLFAYLPSSVGRKFKLSQAILDVNRVTGNHSVGLLRDAGLFHPICHTAANGIPLGAEVDSSTFKPLFLDVGLMSSASGIKQIPFESLQNGSFVNEGAIAEQWVGQALLWSQDFHSRPKLHYWIREGRSNNAEVDYIIEHKDQVIPVEVKSGTSGTLKSIHQFVAIKSNGTALRFDLNLPSQMPLQHRAITSEGSVEVKYNLVSLPLYLAEQAYRLLP